MNGNLLTPVPVADAAGLGGTFQILSPFRSALPVSNAAVEAKWFQPLMIPAAPLPSGHESAKQTPMWPSLLVKLPALTEEFIPKNEPEISPETTPPASAAEGYPFQKAPESDEKSGVVDEKTPIQAVVDYRDEELAEAFAPMIQQAVRSAVLAVERGNIDAFLEPMLRATVRRALAEYSPASTRPFEQPGILDKTVWRMQALFSSKTYEDVLFEKTNRFQVEEVYLLDAKTLALVSFASCDPARHAAVKRVEGAAKRIALQLRDGEGGIRRTFEQADGKAVMAEKGRYMLLVAVVRGRPNEMILADLEFSLSRIEKHFEERFHQAGSALLHALQPFLEDCLLIQAPASAA